MRAEEGCNESPAAVAGVPQQLHSGSFLQADT